MMDSIRVREERILDDPKVFGLSNEKMNLLLKETGRLMVECFGGKIRCSIMEILSFRHLSDEFE